MFQSLFQATGLKKLFDISENTHSAAAEDGCTSITSLHVADQ